MSQLGELLALVHGARTSFRSFRGRYRLWRREDRAVAAAMAFLERVEGAGAAGGLASSVEGQSTGPRVSEGEWRMWFDRPDRVREEIDGEGFGQGRAVRLGTRWWSYDEDNGVLSNEGYAAFSSGVGEMFSAWIGPTALLAALEFRTLSTGLCAGRPTMTAHATIPTDEVLDQRLDLRALHGLGPAASDYILDFDDQYGLILRIEARHDGEPFFVGEALEVGFDETFGEDIFCFTLPSGATYPPG